ncbi:MAG TPA: ABC transporter permease [Pyrinomonadaceae bacterium]|nr:ABC transporter permease [Pyrinomonadaceae bacterium]
MIKDVRYAFRALARRPGFTAVAVITLALGIGANTAIFSVVYGVLLRPLDFPQAERLVALREANALKQPDAQIAPGNFLEWQRQNTVFSDIAAYRTVSYNLTGDGDPERLLAGRISAGLFKTLGVQPVVGRDFLAEEDQPGREKVVIIGAGLWQRRFASDPGVVGRSLKLSGEDFTVVGVMPDGFRLADQREREIWTPIAFTENERNLHHARYTEAIARLRAGVTLDQAQAEMTAIAGRLSQEHPANEGWTVKVAPVLDFAVGDARRILWLLFSAVGLVLLIACANVTNLLLARAATRQKEMAIRVALGAGRLRIVRQLVTESLLLALLGAIAGWPLAVWGLKVLLAVTPADLPRLDAVTIDNRALLFTLAITVITGMIFGLAPALQLANTNANQNLKVGGSEGNRGVAGGRIGSLLIAAEVAIAVVLLVGSGLLLRTIWQLRQINPGFDDHNALAVTLQLSEKKYADAARIASFSKQLEQQVVALPGVQATGVARILPIAHDLPTGFYVDGRPREPDNQLPQTNYSAVSGAYFGAMRIPLLAGRVFDDRDDLQSPRVAIVSAELAQRVFPGESAIGKRINVTTGPESFREIVGVVGDVKQKGLAQETRPHVYEPFAQAPDPFMTLVVRTAGNPSAIVPAIRAKVFELDHELPLQRVTTLDKLISSSIRQQRFASAVLSVFAGVALMLALAGLYGVISYSVAQRTRELGIRVVLGAQVTDVVGLVLKQGMTFVLIGEVAGIAGAFALTRLIGGLLFGVSPTDAKTFVTVAVSLFLVALIACYVPARRATKVDPLVALRI